MAIQTITGPDAMPRGALENARVQTEEASAEKPKVFERVNEENKGGHRYSAETRVLTRQGSVSKAPCVRGAFLLYADTVIKIVRPLIFIEILSAKKSFGFLNLQIIFIAHIG
jgi:hypothetical protein